jgi:hypothetical protein
MRNSRKMEFMRLPEPLIGLNERSQESKPTVVPDVYLICGWW